MTAPMGYTIAELDAMTSDQRKDVMRRLRELVARGYTSTARTPECPTCQGDRSPYSSRTRCSTCGWDGTR